MNAVRHVAYENGAIRNAEGVLVAFYDAEARQLNVNGFVLTFYAENLEAAMEIVARRVP
jgi:hypothetical protein